MPHGITLHGVFIARVHRIHFTRIYNIHFICILLENMKFILASFRNKKFSDVKENIKSLISLIKI